MRVISNTSPLQSLHSIRHVPLLEKLYGSIVVPQAVIDEFHVGKQLGYDVPDCLSYSWMRVERVAIPAVLKLMTNLGSGEAEALALALAVPTDLVILDDAFARQVADSQGIRCTGTLGVLIQAKQQGHIASVMPLVETMQHAGFHMSATLKATVQRIVGE